MSHRGKRQVNRNDDCPVPTKRRKGRPPAVEEEETTSMDPGWTPRVNTDLKMSSIYNRSATEAPAELFRKDLISAMKLPDNEPLGADEYWTISDQWKQEWERGVQVPVNPDSLPGPSVTVISPNHKGLHDFRLPKNKYIRITKDENFRLDDHYLSNMPLKAEKACSYDLDDCDIAWLKLVNGERASMGLQSLREDQLERVIEELEIRCWDKVQTIVKQEEGLGIEFDENVICDVCRSPDSEEGNEMVFCDCCNICVHQACYGITAIPAGSWLCRTCALGLGPECVLCPNKGGAMKCTRSGNEWAHVSCALWIPEVSIGCVERMEPITKISSIPQSRWALICVLCRERVGACIQCSVKTCKTAYHVTCAFKHGLEMKAIIEDENADDGVKLRSYCQKHSVTSKKDRCGSGSEEDECKRKKRKDMTSEEKNQARAAKLQEIEAEFQKHVSASDVTHHHEVDAEGVIVIYNYWVLKRRAACNKPLLAPRSEDVDLLTRQQEQADLDKMKMFVQLRQDLERVRNLCYMVSRREKLSRSFFRLREQTFHRQVSVLTEPSYTLSSTELTAVKEANHGPSIYDRLYSHANAPDLSTDFDTVLARIAGIASPTPEDKGKLELNGLVKTSKTENPYKKMYFNGGAVRRRSIYGSMSSGSETDNKHRLRVDVDSAVSSSEDRKPKTSTRPISPPKRNSVISKEKKLSKKRIKSHATVDSSSEDDVNTKTKSVKTKWESPRSKSLRQMEKELTDKSGQTDDSDEIITLKTSTKKDMQKISGIYSDSDSDPSLQDDDTIPSDSQQLVLLRTKAAVKEFSAGSNPHNKGRRSRKASLRSSKNILKEVDKAESSTEEYQQDKDNHKCSKKKTSKESTPSELIVPQRQAAKKATESMRVNQVKPKHDNTGESASSPKEIQQTLDESKIKMNKIKCKDSKELKSMASREGKLPNDIYEFDKEGGEILDILAYVPQRQAAKKAAEHIKSGRVPIGQKQPQTPEGEVESKSKSNENIKNKKENDTVKSKKELENDKNSKALVMSIKSPEKKLRRASKSVSTSSSSSSTSSGSCSSSSSSESDDIEAPKSRVAEKKSLFDSPLENKIQRRDSQDKKSRPSEKNISKKETPCLRKGQQSPDSISSSSSSSESENDSPLKRKLVPSPKKTMEAIQQIIHDESSKVVVSKKFRKTPDKKLKTSDGRPEFQLQQPPIEGEESTRSKDKHPTQERKSRSGSSDRLKSLETRHGDNTHKSYSSVTNLKSRSRSNTPQRDEKSSVERPSRSLQKKEQTKPSRREGKSSDITESNNTWGRTEPVEDTTRKEKIKPQHTAVESRKIDKKIALRNEDKQQLETGGGRESALEGDSCLSKYQLDGSRKSVTKKGTDNVFEKRYSKSEQENVFVDSNILSSQTKRADKCAQKELSQSDNYINKDKKPLSTSQTMPLDSISKENCEDSSERSGSSTDSEDTSIDIVDTKRTDKEFMNKKQADSKGKSGVMEVDEYIDKINTHAMNVIEIKETLPVIQDSPVVCNKSKIKTQEGIDIKSTSCDGFVKQDPGVFVDQNLSSLNDGAGEDNVKYERPPSRRNSKSDVHSLELPLPKDKNNIQIDLASKHANISNNCEKERHDLQVSEFHVEAELEPKKINSRTSSSSAPSYQQRSIFSPQPQTKDTAVADLFDFGNDMLAVDETVNDDGFGLPRNSDEILRAQPLTFSFGNEFFFKEDSKEDSARETLNLVEKLRLEYAKKTNSQSDLPEPMTPGSVFPPSHQDLTEEPKEEPMPVEPIPPTPSTENLDMLKPTEVECSINVMKSTIEHHNNVEIETEHTNLAEESTDEKNEIPPYHQADPYGYQHCGMAVDIDKVPGREKVDRSNSAQADERWVPPSSIPHHYEPIPSPYPEMHGRNKWADSEVLPSRRSSSSSASSSSSSSHRDDVDPGKREDFQLPPPTPSLLPELVQYPGLHTMPYGPCALPDGQPYHPYSEASQFVGPVGMFPPTCPQMPFPSTSLYPSPFPGPYPGSHSMLPKVAEDTLHIPSTPCTAAFTSSSHNMALTAAMVSPNPPLTPMTPSVHEPPMTPAPFPDICRQLQPPESPVQNTGDYNHIPQSSQSEQETPPLPPPPPPPQKPNAGKKSPAKPTRSSARVIQQQKSPAKSPGISPRQTDPSKTPSRVRDTTTKRGRGSRGGGTSRGRGRGRGRGRSQMHTHYTHPDPNTIHSKLVGTVYDFDFDDDVDNNLENLRAMRERRRSTDIHERKSSDSSFLSRDSSSSPKFSSPHHSSKLRSNYAADVRDLRPPTPVSEIPNHNEAETPAVEHRRIESFPDVVQPMLPGPVDMRTYNSSCEQSSSSLYHNTLVGNSTVENQDQMFAIDDLEHLVEHQYEPVSVNKTDNETIKETDLPATNNTQIDSSLTASRSILNDSRDQLKVKIKGPFLDANYISTVVPVTQPVLPPVAPEISKTIIPSSINASGTSNLRRMRKKELLRQYWTQENMDETVVAVAPGHVAPPIAAPPLSRAVITIPKAVASMTSIPTREDYKFYNAGLDTSNEKRRRKEKSTNDLDNSEDCNERRNSSISVLPDSSHPFKRRGRQPRTPAGVTTPKLKIKIGGNSVEPNVITTPHNDEKKNLRERPPKKRLSSVPMPSVEELRRDSMKFRKMVMANFVEEEKQKNKEVVGGRKKKKGFDVPQIEVIADGAPKLIIRFGKRNEDSGSVPSHQTTVVPNESPPIAPPPSSRTSACSELDKVRTSKITPIRLKLSRCEEGYVMKEPLETLPCSEETPPTPTPATSSLPLSQDCVVR